jgi:hypothetical protein
MEGTPMTYAETVESSISAKSGRPFIASYDLGYEYSQQHYIALQCLVEDADEDSSFVRALEPEAVAF